MVATASHHIRGLLGVRRVRDLARVRRPQLLLGAVHLAVLLTLPDDRVRQRLVRLRPAVLVVAALARASHPHLPARVPGYVLLLPQGLLPRVLAVAAGLR